jgi:hypothetical protein
LPDSNRSADTTRPRDTPILRQEARTKGGTMS